MHDPAFYTRDCPILCDHGQNSVSCCVACLIRELQTDQATINEGEILKTIISALWQCLQALALLVIFLLPVFGFLLD